MRNLLSCFDPASFTIAGVSSREERPIEGLAGVRPIPIAASAGAAGRLTTALLEVQTPLAAYRAAALARRVRACAVMGVYPYVQVIDIAERAARLAGLPFFPYLHDTIVEGTTGRFRAGAAVAVQERVFRNARRLLVMSDGMRDLYALKYGVEAHAVPHTYQEPIPDQPPETPGNAGAFWGGLVYTINRRSFARVAGALRSAHATLTLASQNSREDLERMGVMSPGTDLVFVGDRAEYLRLLQGQGLLVLALDWPDESPVHEDELATIFPTKTPEYLASGRPILVHCPESYYLARFFREYGCGLLVTERSEDRLLAACNEALRGGPQVRAAQAAALRAAGKFGAAAVAGALKKHLDDAVAEAD
jgi:hypothetical protein